MKRIVLMGRSEAGKTTLTQAIKGEERRYEKTQAVNFQSVVIDTPGEYAQTKHLGYALALYSYEADVVGLLCSATEPYSLFPPNITSMANREVIGIVTKINNPKANPERAARWLKLSGCKKIFFVDGMTGEGVDELVSYLKQGKSHRIHKEVSSS